MTLKLVLVCAGLLLALLLLCAVVWLARRRAAGKSFAAAPGRDRSPVMRRLLAPTRAAFASLRQLAPQLRARYAHPLVMLAGPGGSGKSTLLQGCGLHGAHAGPDDPAPGQLRYVDFNQGMVLEVGDAYLALDGGRDAPLWRALARQLQLYRPRRPLDALLLCLPADALLDDLGTLEQRAAVLQARVWALQRQIGLRLPLTILLTCSDRLPGFASLAASVPAGLRDLMLGWSNPRDVEAPFASDWALEACDSMADGVARLQAELMAASVPPADPDSFFLLPAAIEGLRPALAAFLKRLMGAGTECEAPALRGVYLCGDSGPGRAPAFVHDLLATKVLAETGLARPLRDQVFSRDRRARGWRWATAALALVWGGALLHAWFDLGQRADRLLATLRLIEADRQLTRDVHERGRHVDLKTYMDSTGKIVASMAANDRTLTTPALPLSWHLRGLSRLDEDIEARFGAALRDIVLGTIGKGLDHQAAALAGLHQDPVTGAIDRRGGCQPASIGASRYLPQTRVTDMGEFQQLERYVADAARFEAMLATFARLQTRGQGELRELRTLGEYSGAFRLDQEETRPGTYLARALSGVDPGASVTDGRETYRADLRCGFKARSEAFYTRLLDDAEVLQLARQVAAGMRPGGAESDDGFRQLAERLHRLEAWLTAPASAWLHADQPAFGKPYTDLVEQLAAIELLGEGTSGDFRTRAVDGLAALHDKLTAGADEGLAVQVVQRGADSGKLQLTPALAHLETLIAALLEQPFLAPPADLPRAMPEGVLLSWQQDTLDQTLGLVGQQQAYLARELGNFPGVFQEQVKALADRRLGARLVAGVAAAAVPGEPDAELVRRLGQAEKTLTALLEALRALKMDSQAASLAATLAAQSEAALAWLDERFEASGVYLPRDGGFGWWDGSRNPAAQGYTDGDPQGLEDYLNLQHEHIDTVVKLAQPLLRLAAASGAGAASRDSPVVQRWKGIAAELERYKLKQPGSRIAALDAYLRGELSEIDQMNCLDKRGPAINLRGGDYFARRASLLVNRLGARCGELGRQGGSAAYAALAAQFDRTLAQHFPFAPAADGRALAAEPDDVVAFLQAWDRHGADAQRLLARGAGAGMAARQRAFLAAASEVRGFLAPLLPAADGGPGPGYDLRVQFRVNERGEADNFNALQGEIDGNKIVEWTLRVGDRTVRWQSGAGNEVRQLGWRYGMPIVLTLRWAENLAALPFDDGSDASLSVSGREVRYSYSEPWSLLRLLASKRNGAGLGRYETLRFDFPTQALGQARPGRGRVFLRMALSPANQKETLSFPSFPVDAPGNDLSTAMAKPR